MLGEAGSVEGLGGNTMLWPARLMPPKHPGLVSAPPGDWTCDGGNIPKLSAPPAGMVATLLGDEVPLGAEEASRTAQGGAAETILETDMVSHNGSCRLRLPVVASAPATAKQPSTAVKDGESMARAIFPS